VTHPFHPRSAWSTKDPAGRLYTVAPSVRTEFFVHYQGGTPTGDAGAQAMRGIDAGHRANGWSMLGYNFVVMRDGSIWEGRGWDVVGAHCPDHNRTGVGVQVHVGGEQDPSTAALDAVCDLYVQACTRAGHTLAKRGHRDGIATECPGTDLYKWVLAGMPRPSTGRPVEPGTKQPINRPGFDAPPFPLPSGSHFGPQSGPASSVSGYHGHRDDLHRWQERMRLRGWDIGTDGLYGPETASVARHFQREKRLVVDGLIGPATWAAAWRAPVTG